MILYLKDGNGGKTEISVDSAEVELVRDGGTCCDGGDDKSRCQGRGGGGGVGRDDQDDETNFETKKN